MVYSKCSEWKIYILRRRERVSSVVFFSNEIFDITCHRLGSESGKGPCQL